jgi:hypothetical protein
LWQVVAVVAMVQMQLKDPVAEVLVVIAHQQDLVLFPVLLILLLLVLEVL